MNKGFVLNNFINIDSELEHLFNKSSFKNRLLGQFLLIYNDDGHEISFSKKIMTRPGFQFIEEEVANHPESYAQENDPVHLTERIHLTSSCTERFCQTHLKLYQKNATSTLPVAELILLTTEPLAYETLIKETPIWDSMEYLLFYLQMLILSYEKLYLMIDVYTELLISKVHYLPHHLTNVANWCILISNELKLTSLDQIGLYFAALMHDVGLLFVPDDIINKPSALLPEEYELVKSHPVQSAQIAEASFYGIPYFSFIPNIIKHHHENYNGSGYPDGLSGHAIPELSRILSLADSVDAMLSHRTYRAPLTKEQVIEEISRNSGILFDPEFAHIMIRVMEEHKFMPSEALNDVDFIPHASLSFFFKDIKTIKAYTGNIIISKQKGKFMLHESEGSFSELAVKDIHRCTISFFKQNEFIEFNTEVYGLLDNKLFLTDFVYLPADKYFSLAWSSETKLYCDSMSLNVMIIKLGGNSVILEVSLDAAAQILSAPLGSLKMTLKETVSDLEIDELIHIRIARYYKTGKSLILNCSYFDLPPATCDLILKLLFKRQIELKLNSMQCKKNKAGAQG